MAFIKQLETLKKKKDNALLMGGTEKIKKRHSQGKLTARERMDRLLDPDSFFEIGMLNCSDVPDLKDNTPADSKVSGFGKINGREVVVIANDFTVLAATSSRIASKKEAQLKTVSEQKGLPLIYLGESGGARMPDIMGSKGLGSIGGDGSNTFVEHMTRTRQSPMVAAVMGKCYGMPTWMACIADFVVQVKGSTLAVSGPRVLEIALGEKISDEELGGWEKHARITGLSDCVAENDEACLDMIKTFLGYLPSNHQENPPKVHVPETSGKHMDKILEIIPEKRNRTYDMHRILECIVDSNSLFFVKPLFGTSVITALSRIGGESVGIIASQPLYNAGAMDTDGIDKVTSFMCLCDSYNIPLVFFHDTPGFLVGNEAENNRVGARVMNHLSALAQVTVPKISVIIRKSFGMAYYNMCGSGCGADFLVAWPTAEMSFIDPEIGFNVIYGNKLNQFDMASKDEAIEDMIEDSSPYGAAGMHYIHDVIDPHETRNYIVRALEICRNTPSKAISKHKLANWPTKF
jgi:acetyl-CoA carboxylase carboxyltransferase component